MKFRGLIITDALDMGGVTSNYRPAKPPCGRFEAGTDVLLMSPSPDAAIAGLEDAVKSGRISEKRIDESVRRILAAKARLGLNKNRYVDVARLNEKFARPEYETAGAEHRRSRRHAAARHSVALAARRHEAAARAAGRAFVRPRSESRRNDRARNSPARRFAQGSARGYSVFAVSAR